MGYWGAFSDNRFLRKFSERPNSSAPVSVGSMAPSRHPAIAAVLIRRLIIRHVIPMRDSTSNIAKGRSWEVSEAQLGRAIRSGGDLPGKAQSTVPGYYKLKCTLVSLHFGGTPAARRRYFFESALARKGPDNESTSADRLALSAGPALTWHKEVCHT